MQGITSRCHSLVGTRAAGHRRHTIGQRERRSILRHVGERVGKTAISLVVHGYLYGFVASTDVVENAVFRIVLKGRFEIHPATVNEEFDGQFGIGDQQVGLHFVEREK